ncbi:MAG: hypothetical protein OXI81_02075 [Paracoccaceae bacterium]|nr:hypothetical protein [Paracoccaceae bacterium]MDE2914156.1 hypothetical protein [Paracoccaceae bacterium]
MMIAAIGHAILVAAALRVAWVDARRYEIEYESLAVMAAAGVALTIRNGGAGALVEATFLSAAVTLAMAGLVRARWIRRPGAGDWALMAVGLFLGAGNLALFAVILATAGTATATVFAIRRRRPVFRSRFPLAPPAVLAAATTFLLGDALPFAGFP